MVERPPASSRGTDSVARIGKQIRLPWSKAIEIAGKSIRVRFWRSMITMSSIVLAIAFLMSIWTSTAVLSALAVRPQREIEALKERLAAVRDAIDRAAGALSAEAIEKRFAADMAAALKRNSIAVRDIRKAIAAAASDKRPMLETDLAKLQAMAKPGKRLQLLHDYLADRRRQLEQRKGDLDQALQQERAGRDQEPQPSTMASAGDTGVEAVAARAVPRGGLAGFLSHMSATDKWLAILALLVCFVGITNAMFMTVQERFREIGTMKCLGALDSFIVKIFLLESAALGLIGTLIGILVGLLLSTLRQLLVYGTPVFSYFPLLNLLAAGGLAALIGLLLSILAAILPARNAARMEPVEAMRIEE